MTIFGWSVGILFVLQFFSAAKLILLGFLSAAAVASMLSPVVRWLPGPRGLRAGVVGLGFLLVVLGVVFLASWQLAAPLGAQLQNWPEVQKKLDVVLTDWSGRLGMTHTVTVSSIADQVSDLVTGHGATQLVSETANLSALLLVVAMFVFIGSIYMLAEPPGRLMMPILKMLPPRRVGAMKAVVSDLGPRLRWWLIGTLISMVAVGAASLLGYYIVGLQWAVPLAIFAGVTEIVPTVGPALTFILGVLLAATQGYPQVIGVLIVYAIVQTLESYVLIPLVMRSAVNIPPLVTLFTIVLWGKVLGVAGLLLAVPIDLVIWSLIDHFIIRPDDVDRPP